MHYFLTLALLLFTGVSAASETQSVEIKGNQIAYSCKGTGERVALLISGMGLDSHGTYKNTFKNAAPRDYRLCRYDRAGTGASTFPNRRVRNMPELAEELSEFVAKTHMNRLVLVAHSFGGFVARAFAHKNPDKVDSIIFVDAAHESWYQDMRASMSENAWQIMLDIIEWEKHVHSFEDFAEASSHSALYSLLKPIPIVVMPRGIPHYTIRQTGMDYQDVNAYEVTWMRAQEKLKTLSPNTDVVKMEYASHLFDQTDPWIVIKQIEQVMRKTSEL
jgi:pimeloyl-ACP methyl ester carboxylesterase